MSAVVLAGVRDEADLSARRRCFLPGFEVWINAVLRLEISTATLRRVEARHDVYGYAYKYAKIWQETGDNEYLCKTRPKY